jgi:NADPH-dependent F420 reductase
MTKNNTDNKMTLAIIGGTGKEGPGLAMRWAYAGYPIIIGSRSQEKAELTAKELNQQLNINSIRGMINEEAVRNADICILTVVHTAHETILESLKECLKGKILIDTTARIDYTHPTPPSPPSAGRIAQNLLGNDTIVVAAYQNVPAHVLRKGLNESLNLDVIVCSDDIESANTVIELTNAIGMKAYYGGNLDQAIVLEGLTSLLININKHYKIKTASIAIRGINN